MSYLLLLDFVSFIGYFYWSCVDLIINEHLVLLLCEKQLKVTPT